MQADITLVLFLRAEYLEMIVVCMQFVMIQSHGLGSMILSILWPGNILKAEHHQLGGA